MQTTKMIYLLSSIDFFLFLMLVFVLYWILPKKLKNVLLLISCYLFYVSWNWKFLSLILISTLMNYTCGLKIYAAKNRHLRRLYLTLAIATDLSILIFFKYFNFFIESLISLFSLISIHLNLTLLKVILPLGISFYTFETISYIIDVYRKKFAPTENLIDFAVFVAYFPKLISGPIERARNLMPKIQAEKNLESINFQEGFYLIVYGLFKKIVIADSLAPIVNSTFASYNQSGSQIIIAAYAFAIQLYCDFSGYIDIARGASNLLGIKLSVNFNNPYFAKNPSDFWGRWHMTLSSWVRDYIYIPLGGMNSKFLGIFPLLVSWTAMGLWHGAALNFLLWGVYWFFIVVFYRIIKLSLLNARFNHTKNKYNKKCNKFFEMMKGALFIVIMFHITLYGWIIFRSQSLMQIIIFTKSLIGGIEASFFWNIDFLYIYAIMLFLIIYEFLQYYKGDELFICKKNFYYQLIFYIMMFLMFINIESISNAKFLYFQF